MKSEEADTTAIKLYIMLAASKYDEGFLFSGTQTGYEDTWPIVRPETEDDSFLSLLQITPVYFLCHFSHIVSIFIHRSEIHNNEDTCIFSKQSIKPRHDQSSSSYTHNKRVFSFYHDDEA